MMLRQHTAFGPNFEAQRSPQPAVPTSCLQPLMHHGLMNVDLARAACISTSLRMNMAEQHALNEMFKS